MLNHKLLAFTIVEMLVGLLIGSIAISLAILTFLNFKKATDNFTKQSDYDAKIESCYLRLQRDFQKDNCLLINSNTVFFCNDVILGNQLSYKDSSIYLFDNNAIVVTTQMGIDSFLFSSLTMSSICNKYEPELIEHCEINFDNKRWTFEKTYPSNKLMNE